MKKTEEKEERDVKMKVSKKMDNGNRGRKCQIFMFYSSHTQSYGVRLVVKCFFHDCLYIKEIKTKSSRDKTRFKIILKKLFKTKK